MPSNVSFCRNTLYLATSKILRPFERNPTLRFTGCYPPSRLPIGHFINFEVLSLQEICDRLINQICESSARIINLEIESRPPRPQEIRSAARQRASSLSFHKR